MIAVDIGGTYTRYKSDGSVFKLKTSEIVLTDFLEDLIFNYKPEKIAVSFAGQVKNKKIFSSPNTAFENIDLTYLEKKHGVEIILENDMNCAALAESKYLNINNLTALYSGTGLGAGIIDRGEIVKGRGFAGEIGHVPYKESPFVCKCGKTNCLELFASGSGIKKWSAYYSSDGLNDEKIKNMYINALIFAVGTVFSLFDSEIVVLGGGVILSNPWILNEIQHLKDRYIPGFNTKKIKITKLKDASLLGAEILLKDRV